MNDLIIVRYWQFKNGTLRKITSRSEFFDVLNGKRFRAWDRSLGAWVYYA